MIKAAVSRRRSSSNVKERQVSFKPGGQSVNSAVTWVLGDFALRSGESPLPSDNVIWNLLRDSVLHAVSCDSAYLTDRTHVARTRRSPLRRRRRRGESGKTYEDVTAGSGGWKLFPRPCRRRRRQSSKSDGGGGGATCRFFLRSFASFFRRLIVMRSQHEVGAPSPVRRFK